MQQDNLGRLWAAQGLRHAFGPEESALRLRVETGVETGIDYRNLTEGWVLALDVPFLIPV